ncbi:MAG: paraquat-inducible protein A [Thermodesulfobacteriota bacterium]
MDHSLIACHECDLLHRTAPLPSGGTARCVRCGALLYRRRRGTVDSCLALTVAGLILFAVANAFPLLAMRLDEEVQQAVLVTGVLQLWDQGAYALAGLVLVTSILAPLAKLGLFALVLAPLRLGLRPPAWAAPAFRLALRLSPWSMLEVFLLGILVAMVKLADTADILLGPSLYAFGLLIPVLAWVSASLDPEVVWDRLGQP